MAGTHLSGIFFDLHSIFGCLSVNGVTLNFPKLNVSSTDRAESSDALLFSAVMENEHIFLKSTLSVLTYRYFDI